MRALLALIAVTAVWGVTFVQVKDAVALYPLFAFLAVRFAIASLVLAVPAAGRMRSLGRPGWLAGSGARAAARAPATHSRRPGSSGRPSRAPASSPASTSSSRRCSPCSSSGRAVGRAVWLGVALAVVGLALLTGRRRGRPAGDLLVLGALGGLLAADRPDGAVRAALRPGRVHPGGDARRVRGLRGRRGRARPGRGAARLDGLGRAARHGRLRERARVPRADVGAAADERDEDGTRVRDGAGLGGLLRLLARGRPARRARLDGLRGDHGRDRRRGAGGGRDAAAARSGAAAADA